MLSDETAPTTALLNERTFDGDAPTSASLENLSGGFSPRGSRKKCWWLSFCTSCLLLVFIPLYIEHSIYQGIIQQVVMDSDKAQGYEMFRNRSRQGGTQMEYTFFNITNPEQVLKGAKPRLEEIGPFIYKQTQLRDDLEFDYPSDRLSFRQQVYQTFDVAQTIDRTDGKFSTDQVKVTTVNILFLGMKAIVGRELWHLINEVTLWNTDLKRMFDTRTVHELIEGYKVPLKLGPVTIPISFPGLVPSHVKPRSDPEYRFRNTILMGKKDLNKANSLVEWGPGKTHSQITCPWGNNPLSHDCEKFAHNPCCGFNLHVRPWKQDIYPDLWNADANKVQGTLGDAFRPFLTRREDETVTVWSDQLARALQFHNQNAKVVNHHGIELLRFVATDEFWANSTVHPPNHRFYQHGPHGLLNASILYAGVPVYVSLPHFLRCDPRLLEGVEGLNPDPELHEMFLDIEPTTGMTFREHNRIQVNALITGKERFGLEVWFPHMKTAYIPIGFFDAHSDINKLGIKEFLKMYDGFSILWGAMSLGVVFMFFTLFGPPMFSWFAMHHRITSSRKLRERQVTMQRVLTMEEDGCLSPLAANGGEEQQQQDLNH